MLALSRFLVLCVAVLALPAIAVSQTPPPLSPGWYHNGALIYEAKPGDNLEGLRIFWENSYVYEHPGKDPLYWYAHVVYRNSGNKTLTLWCTGRNDRTLAKEHMTGTANSGYVPSEETFCSHYTSLIFSLAPGHSYNGWAIFHNVPWRGGKVSLDWGQYGRSQWVDPWATGPFFGRPPDVCPPELVKLGTCKPPAAATRALGDNERKALEDFVSCETDLLHALGWVAGATLGATVGPVGVAVVAGAGLASKITTIGALAGGLTSFAAIVQDPKNPNNWIQLGLDVVPGATCVNIVSAAALGANKTIITPLINAVTH